MPLLVMRHDFRAPAFGPASTADIYDAALAQFRWADQQGWDFAVVSEHHGLEDGWMPSPVMIAGVIAGMTERIPVLLSAAVVPLHDPVRLAEQLAVLDHATKGRVMTVAGAGYRPEEFEMAGADLKRRGKLLEEFVGVMLQAWTGEPFEWQGRTIQVTPKPFTQPHPTLLMGGGVEVAARRAARLRLPMMPMNEDPRLSEWYADEAAKTGFEDGFVMTPSGPTFVHVSHDPDAAWAEIAPYVLYEAQTYASFQTGGQHSTPMVDADSIEDLKRSPQYLVGTPDQIVEAAGTVSPMGALTFNPLAGGLPPDISWASLELFASEVMPRHPTARVVDARAPVLVGVGAVTQHDVSLADSLDAFELMARAAELAGIDCGVPAALARVGLVLASRGLWSYRDAGRAVAARFGATGAASVVGEIGILQQTLLTRAGLAIADGHVDVVLVLGAEAKFRALQATKQGVDLVDPDPSTGDPDEVLAPVGDIITRMEVERELAMPAHQYATIESAIAHVEQRTPAEQRAHVAELWSRFAAVAVGNPDAWDRRGHSAAEIGTAGPGNRAIAMPYTKLLCSQWNVDQSAALLMMAAETASSLGIARDRWVFAHAAAESNQMVPLPYRREIHRWPAFEAVADALGLTEPDAVVPSVREIYSCFPAAVQVQARALGLALDAPLTESGGMTFGGGPLNSSVLQSMVPFARRLRTEPEAAGLITSVSGMITKPGASVWSVAPPAAPFHSTDVTAEAVARTAVHPLVPDAVGPATIAADTVVFDGDDPARAVVVLDVDGGRTVARCGDVDVARAMTESDWVGRAVRVVSPGAFVVD